MTKLIILRGYPGSGKTAIGKRLSEEGIGRFIDHNAILTFIANIVGNDEGIYDDIANLEVAMVRKLLKERSNVIVARGFGKIENMKVCENIANELGIDQVIVRLEVAQSTLAKRVMNTDRLNDFNPTVSEEALEA